MKRTAFDSPVGRLEICEIDGKITRIEIISPEDIFEENSTPVLEDAKKQLSEYFCGKRKAFDLPLEFSGTDFQKAVWGELVKIPFGKTKTYGEIAAAIEKPKASRAVGGACNRNHILIVVPCHRVIGSNGDLTGFACGMDKKIWLLGHEAIDKKEKAK
ncbi:MAG: methylated-DNA--[Oscillospiraceae bacterium]|nr:methylated-DNA--[protein]-cysteine S-methyltransferase [Oscillospiraceae bacterium]